MSPGKIVLAALQQSDGKYKIRPVLILKVVPPYNDFLVCAISSKTHNFQKKYDFLLGQEHSEFLTSGLKTESLIRICHLATLPNDAIEGAIGKISHTLYAQIINSLTRFLRKKRHNEI